MPSGGRTSRFFPYLALALLVAVSATYRVREISDRVELLRRGEQHARDPFNVEFFGSEILNVEPEAETAGIQSGDTLVAR